MYLGKALSYSALEDLNRDGDHKVSCEHTFSDILHEIAPLLQLLVGDLGNGHVDMKLKVYKGTMKCSV